MEKTRRVIIYTESDCQNGAKALIQAHEDGFEIVRTDSTRQTIVYINIMVKETFNDKPNTTKG